MESLFEDYPIIIRGDDEFKTFESFYSRDLSSIEVWLKTKFLTLKLAKSSVKSQKLRNQGNLYFSKKQYEKSSKHFSLALNYAEYNTEEYSLALANRSAAFFHLDNYKDCIKDVDNCLKSNYPKKVEYKLFVRKAQCLEKIQSLTNDFIEDAKNVILKSDNITEEEKENQIKKIKCLNTKAQRNEKEDFTISTEWDFEENPNFAYASQCVKLCFDNKRGRHVRASRNINQGEIIFLEDALFFAPVFEENMSLIPNKCHNCLCDVLAFIPCKSCAAFIYCDEKCRDESWNEFHQWECVGMTANIWYFTGIVYPAFRGMVKGMKSKFPEPGREHKQAIEKFGDKENNYIYFNQLLTHLEMHENLTQVSVLSALVIKYLEMKTDFFIQVKQINNMSLEEIKIKCGGLLIRHMLQLSSNSSVIEHWNKTRTKTERIPTEYSQIACAIYPSVSMMNHACKANITMCYNKTKVIVRALHNIKEGEEILNCYGVDYRSSNKKTRRNILKSLYHFSCECEICTNPLLEYDIFDSYLCQNCQGPLSDISGVCYTCKKPALLEYFKRLELEADNYINKDSLTIDDIDKCYKIRSSIYVKNHKKIAQCFDEYKYVYMKNGNLVKMFEYFKKYLSLMKITLGNNSRSLAVESIYTISDAIEELKKDQSNPDKMFILKEIMELYCDTHKVLLLYYPSDMLMLSDIDEFIKENKID